MEEKVAVIFTGPFRYAYGGRFIVEYEPAVEPVEVSARCAEVAIGLGVAHEPGAAKAAPKKAAKK